MKSFWIHYYRSHFLNIPQTIRNFEKKNCMDLKRNGRERWRNEWIASDTYTALTISSTVALWTATAKLSKKIKDCTLKWDEKTGHGTFKTVISLGYLYTKHTAELQSCPKMIQIEKKKYYLIIYDATVYMLYACHCYLKRALHSFFCLLIVDDAWRQFFLFKK